jgi:hypothetical protein
MTFTVGQRYPWYNIYASTDGAIILASAEEHVCGSTTAILVYLCGRPRFVRSYTRDVPSTYDTVHHPAFVQDRLSAPERQFVKETGYQALRRV